MSNEVIIWTNADGDCVETVPGSMDINELRDLIEAENSVTAFITTTDQLPQDEIFRNAWEEDGVQVTENLDKSKQIALVDVRFVADKTTGFIQRSFLLNEDAGGVTQDDVTNAYEQAKQDIENATQVPFIKAAVEVFKSTYDIVED